MYGVVGYGITVGSLILATISFAVAGVGDTGSLSLGVILVALMIFLFLFYVVTAKYLMQSRVLSRLSAEGFKEFLVESDRYRHPYKTVTYLPFVLVFTCCLYVFVVLLPNSFGG